MSVKPPRAAEWLTEITTSDEDRAAILGDLAEEFELLVRARGRSAASRWYIRQAVTSAAPNLRRRLLSVQPYRVHDSRSARMSSIFQDLRFAWRQLGRRPGLALVAGLSMTAGIALTATVFSLMDAAVLRPLPVADPDRLAVILSQREGGVNHNLSYPDFSDYRAGQRTLVDMAASSGGSATVTVRAQSGALVVNAEMVSGTYFGMLGIGARAGRVLNEQDLAPSSPPAAVVSESLWRELAGAGVPFDGRAAIVNGQSFAIVGIVDRRFHGIQVGRDVRFWTTINQQPIVNPSGAQPYWNRRTVSWLTLLARLKPETTLEAAGADLNRVEQAIGPTVDRQEKRSLFLVPGAQGDSMLPGAAAEPLQLLLGAALVVMLVATANVASLLGARASDRQRELSVRMALGAGRSRLLRLLVAEALLIGGLSSVVALAASAWFAGAVVPLLPGVREPEALDIGINWRIGGLVAALGLVTIIVSSLVPIARVWRTGVGAVADAGRTIAAGRARVRQGLVVAQFAMSLALVVAATLLIRTLINVRSIDTGLELNRVVLMEVDPSAAGYDGPRVKQYISAALEKLTAVPGVTSAGFGRVIPLGFGGSRATIAVAGYTPRPDEDMEINFNRVTSGYFEALGISALRGRVVSEQDVAGAPTAAVVNETMARRYWPDGSAVGRTFRFEGDDGPPFEVVGVVRDVKYRTIREDVAPSFYSAAMQAANPRGGVMHVRTQGEPGPMIAALRKALAEVDRNVPVKLVRTLREQRDRNTANERLAVTIGVVLGGVALALAAVGLFAAMSSAVAQRTREIGVRLALGANPGRMITLVLSDSLRLVLAGAAIGLVAAYWMSQYVEQRLYGITARDPVSFVAGVVVLTAVALLAAWAPARRASKVDPIQALRTE